MSQQPDHHHRHHYHHPHHHHHSLPTNGRRYFWAIVLNAIYVVIELFAGVLSGSVAIISDAVHNLGDILALGLSWFAFSLSQKKPSKNFTYGFKKSSILAAFMNASLLLVTTGGLIWEAIGRVRHPVEVNTALMIWIPFIGVLVNTFSAFLFHKGQSHDINERGAFLHLVGDAAVSLGVVVAGVVVLKTGWTWVDALASLVISAVILKSAVSLLLEATHMLMDGVPKSIEIEGVIQCLLEFPEIESVHDIHVWSLGATSVAMTGHLVICVENKIENDFLRKVESTLHDRFGIDHTTMQIEHNSSTDCAGCST